jgi:5-methylcytosine-specific restriction protein A
VHRERVPRDGCGGNKPLHATPYRSWRNAPARPDLDSAWDRLSLRRRKAFPVCEVPGCTRPSESTDHVIPASEGGTSEWGNLQALCGPDHREKTVRESHRAAKRKAAARKAARYF